MRRWFLFVAITIGSGTSVHAFCSEPSFSGNSPDAPSIILRPSIPSCLSEYKWSGRHRCDSGEIDSYNNEVDDYIPQIRDYADEAVEFAQEARNFAIEASYHPRCEAEEVASQHKLDFALSFAELLAERGEYFDGSTQPRD